MLKSSTIQLVPPVRGCSISQLFGGHPEWYIAYGARGHWGIDWACIVGTPVYAMHEGVLTCGSADKSGIFACIEATHGRSTYAHLSTVLRSGWVRAGGLIALSGNTGRSTGPHLHVDYMPYPVSATNGYLGRINFLDMLKEMEMASTKMAVQVQRQNDGVQDFLRAALFPAIMGIVSSTTPEYFLEILPAYEEAGRPAPIVFPRKHNDAIADAYKQGAAGARVLYDDMMPVVEEWREVLGSDVTTSLNERIIDESDIESMMLLSECEAELCRMLAVYNTKVIIGNFGVWHPPLSLWEYYGEALAQPNAILGLHEYAREDLPWHPDCMFKYRQSIQAIRGFGHRLPPVWLTEFGWDRCVATPPGTAHGGFQEYNQQAYLAWVDEYHRQIQLDPEVDWAFVYMAGAKEDWATFDLVGSAIEEPYAAYVRAGYAPPSFPGGFTSQELQAARMFFSTQVPATVKRCNELLYQFEGEIVRSDCVLAIAYDPEIGVHKVLKLSKQTWQVIAETTI